MKTLRILLALIAFPALLLAGCATTATPKADNAPLVDIVKPDIELKEIKDEYGKATKIIKSKNGVQLGVIELSYFPSGELKIKANTFKGELNGLATEYYKNGDVLWKANFENGLLNGDYFEYFDNGQLNKKTHYRNDLKHGSSQQWDKVTATIKYEEIYDKGIRLHEFAYTYRDNGTLEFKRRYVDGVLMGLSFSYYSSGQLKSAVPFKDGSADGEAKAYYDTGLSLIQIVRCRRRSKGN